MGEKLTIVLLCVSEVTHQLLILFILNAHVNIQGKQDNRHGYYNGLEPSGDSQAAEICIYTSAISSSASSIQAFSTRGANNTKAFFIYGCSMRGTCDVC
jgi:hypothetical protein